MTAWGSVEVAVEAMRRGARDFVQKPWENARLLTILRTQVELARALRRQQRLEAENRSLKPDVRPMLIAEAVSMRPVLELISRVGPSEANVLVTGENGTGKGTVAQAIHAVSGRAGKGLVTVNAGGLSEGVFESELFGHVKGRVHRRQDRPRRPVRARRRRHAVPRRNRQRAAEPAAEAAARARDRRLRARRVVAHAARQRAHRVGDQLQSRRRSRRRPLPPGSAVPPEHDRDPAAAAARSARGHPGAGDALPAAARAALPEEHHRLRAGRAAGAARSSVAGQHPRARSRGRARRADGAGRRPSGSASSGCASIATRRRGSRT